jgi:putative oxygen-independent coproporphyrinogen III oxidase
MRPPLSLYVHLPWCVRKCPYCDFNSHTAGGAADKGRYVDALVKDIRQEGARAGDREVETVFFGGGTPSYFDAGEIGRLLEAIAGSCRLSDRVEVTMEANPGTVERDRLAEYRRAGVNRLSLGAQSFNGESLRRLGRIHGPEEVTNAWRDAVKAGFTSINIDLMYALPGQTLATARSDIEQAIALGPQHVSWYQLTLEPNTVFHARPPSGLPDEELAWAIEQQGYELLGAAGYDRYETSAFAKPGHRCRHNLNYWQFGDYLAAGAGAHGKFTDDDGTIWRYRKPPNPSSYMQKFESDMLDVPKQRLPAPDIVFEFMLNALRLSSGFTTRQFTGRTGLPWSVVLPGVTRAESLGLLRCGAGKEGDGLVVPTAHGRRFLNDLQALFLPEASAEASPVPGDAGKISSGDLAAAGVR